MQQLAVGIESEHGRLDILRQQCRSLHHGETGTAQLGRSRLDLRNQPHGRSERLQDLHPPSQEIGPRAHRQPVERAGAHRRGSPVHLQRHQICAARIERGAPERVARRRHPRVGRLPRRGRHQYRPQHATQKRGSTRSSRRASPAISTPGRCAPAKLPARSSSAWVGLPRDSWSSLESKALDTLMRLAPSIFQRTVKNVRHHWRTRRARKEHA